MKMAEVARSVKLRALVLGKSSRLKKTTGLRGHGVPSNIGRQYRIRRSIDVGELLTKIFFGGFVRMHVLYHAVREPIYGVEMMEELARHGYEVGAGTMYPMLHQLEQAGYLTSYSEVVMGKQRKYYRATPEGARALDEAKSKLRELVKEVLHDDPPTPSIQMKPEQP
jgi:DNA-binding PadR family transcriptional regulator